MTDEGIRTVLEVAAARARLPGAPRRRHIREEAGLSQADMAKGLGVTRATISRWERGDRTPSAARLVAYETLLARLARESAYSAESDPRG